MKKIISIVIVLALLLSTSCITAFASTGPFIPLDPRYVGARLEFYDYDSDDNIHILRYDYTEGHMVIDNEAVEGAVYDLATNTLTLTDFDHPTWELSGLLMGDDFTINVVGTCNLRNLAVNSYMKSYTCGLTITGTGTLNINESGLSYYAVYLERAHGMESAVCIDEGVTVNLYEGTSGGSLYIYNSDRDNKDQAITAGGKPVDGVTGGEITYEDSDYVNTIYCSTYDEVSEQGYLMFAKNDPEGTYVAVTYGGEDYRVYRYVYYPAFDDYGRDLSFESEWLSLDELLEKYEFVTDLQPTKALFYTHKEYNERGYHGYRMTCEDDPEGIYVGVEYWDWDSNDFEDPDGYRVYQVYWDEDEEYYVEDEWFETIEYPMDELDESPYSFVTEKVEKNVELNCWVKPPTAENEEDNYKNSYEVVEYSEDPDTLYICEPYWDSSDFDKAPAGYYVFPVYVDQDTGDYYIDSYHFDSETDFHFTCDEFASSGFSFVTGIFDEYVDCHFLGMYYNPSYHAHTAILLRKTGDEDTLYGYNPNHIFVDTDEIERHPVYRFDTYNEDCGFWFVDDESYVWMSPDEMKDAEFEVVCSDQNVVYYTKSYIGTEVAELYTDDAGVRYAYVNTDGISRIDEENALTDYNGETYYFTEPCDDISVDDLNDTKKTVHTGSYYYQIKGDFHYPAAGDPGSVFTVSGVATSYKTTSEEGDDDVTLTLTGTDNNYTDAVTVTAEYSSTAVGAKAETAYSFESVPAGTYDLTVEKKNHVTRKYEVTVSEDVTQAVKICPKGDVNNDGYVRATDAMMAYRHAQGKTTITDEYQFACGNVVGNDAVIKAPDAMMIYRQAQGKHSLF